MDYPPNMAPPPVHYGWVVPPVVMSSGQPPPYTLNPVGNGQYPIPLAVELHSVGQPPPYTPPGDARVDIESPDATRSSFSEKEIRMAFIRKVYAILMVQLAITTGFIALFLFEPNIARFSRENPELMLVSMGCTAVLTIVIVCFDKLRRTWPMNFILLMAFTVCEGWMLGTVCSFFQMEEVFLAVAVCSVVCLALTIFAFQTKWDFTASGGLLFVGLIVLTLFGFVAMYHRGGIVHLIYSAMGALMFSFFLVYDTQLMLGGNHKMAISPEEYIFAALSIYLDIIQMFMHILALIGDS